MGFASVLSAIGSIFTGYSSLKATEGGVIKDALGTLNTVTNADAASQQAVSTSITTIMQYGTGVEKSWRAWFAIAFGIAILSRWAGYVPPNMTAADIEFAQSMFAGGFFGYQIKNSIDRWIQGLQIGNILKMYLTNVLNKNVK